MVELSNEEAEELSLRLSLLDEPGRALLAPFRKAIEDRLKKSLASESVVVRIESDICPREGHHHSKRSCPEARAR